VVNTSPTVKTRPRDQIEIARIRYSPQRVDEGLDATRAIWSDMLQFDGDLDHEIVQDLDDPGHLFVVGRWRSREAADAALSYASHPNARLADRLVSEPRRRTVGVAS
jgi:quinol monooxygenase YgiN